MKKIKIYISLLLICLITGCATQSTKHKAEKIYYSSSGFALIYNDLDYKNGAVSRKLNNKLKLRFQQIFQTLPNQNYY